MIDYTQDAFFAPPMIDDPIPTVADYLDDYQARNDAWYRSWAYPLGDGRYGARPSSFERYAPYIPPVASEIPEDVLPPVLRDSEESEDRRVKPEDRPVGWLVRDVGGMPTPALGAEQRALQGNMGMVGPAVASGINALAGGIPVLPSLMASQGIRDRISDIIGERMFRAPQLSAAPDLFFQPDAVAPPVAPPPRRRDEYGGRQDSDRGRDTYQGGEVGAGGWAGSGGL